jgi:hypothetical protein
MTEPATRPAQSAPLVRRADVAAALRVVGWCLLAGLVVGVVWGLAAPSAVRNTGYLGPCANEVDCAGFFTSEVVFGIGTAVVGLAFAALMFRLHRDAGIALVVALAVGGVLGALVAARTGVWVGAGRSEAAVAALPAFTEVEAPRRLDAWALLLAWPVASMFLVLWLSAGMADHPPHEQPAGGEVSSATSPPS